MEVNSSSSDSIWGKLTPPTSSPFSQKHQTLSAGNEAVALRSLCFQPDQEWQKE